MEDSMRELAIVLLERVGSLAVPNQEGMITKEYSVVGGQRA